MQIPASDDDPVRSEVEATSHADVSVIVPTYNRRDRLECVLKALGRQSTTTPTGRVFDFEVIVVSDGSTDGTADMVRSLPASYPLRLIEQENAGPATARNRGVEVAGGRTLVFIDDDVVPWPNCLAAHVARHDESADLVVIGPMLTPQDADLSPWVAWEQHQLYKQYRRFAGGERAYARQFYTGNASVSRAAVVAAGGFDSSFRRAEDVELAHRLEGIGQHFAFEPDAEAFHYAERSLDSWLQVASDYGQNDVTFSERDQPWMRDFIADGFARRNIAQRALVRLSISSPARTDQVRRLVVRAALALDRVGLRHPSRWFLSAAYGVNYYAAVASGLGSPRALADLLARRSVASDSPFCAVFVLEQTLGHVTHAKNLESLVPADGDVMSVFLPVDSALVGLGRRIPGWSNWTVRAGIRARRSLRQLFRSDPHMRADAMFVHSQVPAVLLGRWMRRLPTVVSLDATPEQYDDLGAYYSHDVGPAPIERIKHWANRRCFSSARHLITWSEWAKQGLVEGYGISPGDVTVIAPGVDVRTWAAASEQGEHEGPLRILFVGADARRKGGELLIEAAHRLRMIEGTPPFEVHIVTASDLPAETGLFIHAGLNANSPELIEQYQLADIFCLPTFGDCLPMVLAEAGAAGLPLVSTDVGAISELVRDGETGCLIKVGDTDGLVKALAELLASKDTRQAYGGAARALIERDHDAAANAERIISVLRSAAK